MMHRSHTYVMVAMVVVGAGLFFSGAVDGGALLLLWPLLCMGMMFVMMWGMMRMNRQPDDTSTPDHVDRTTTSLR